MALRRRNLTATKLAAPNIVSKLSAYNYTESSPQINLLIFRVLFSLFRSESCSFELVRRQRIKHATKRRAAPPLRRDCAIAAGLWLLGDL